MLLITHNLESKQKAEKTLYLVLMSTGQTLTVFGEVPFHRKPLKVEESCNINTLYNVCAVPWRVLSTVGDILSTVGDILSTVGLFSTVGDIMSTVGDIMSTGGGYLEYRGGCSVPWGIS